MKIKQIIKNVNSVLQDSRGVFITNVEGFCDINEMLIQKGDYFNTSNRYIYGYDGEVTIVKIEDIFEIISSGYTSGCTVFSSESIICYKLKLKENKVDYKLRNQNNLIDFSLTGRNVPISLFKDKITFTDWKRQVFLYDITSNISLWHYTLPDGFKIFGSVQAIDNVLFFSCTDANLRNSKLIGLEIETGKVLWQFENLIDFQVDFKHRLLRGYQGVYYQVIDPFKGKLVVNKDLKELWDKGIDPTASNNTITEDKLWFVSGRGENTKFGAINLETSEIDFIQDFSLENDGQLDKPVFHQGKLYLHDSNNILYVLE